MKGGMTLVQMAEKLEAEKARKHDIVVDTSEITVLTGEAGTEVIVPEMGEIAPQQLFHRQLGQDLGIRADFYDRLRGTPAYAPDFDQLVNGMLRHRAAAENDGKRVKRMVRTYTDGGPDGQGIARALLSDRYRRIDNVDVAEAVIPIILQEMAGMGAEVPVCELTETRMYIKVLLPNMQRNLKDYISPGRHEFLPEGPDYVQAGFVVTNSEVGAAALKIEHMLYRLVCTNGLIVGKAMRRNHVGRQAEVSEDYSIYSDETTKQDDKALMMKVADATRHAVNEAKFDQLARQFAATAAGEQIEHPAEAMKVLAPKLGLTDGEGESVLQHLIAGRDMSQFGAINAVTRAAHDIESFDRSIELEQMGAQVMEMGAREWGELVAA